MMYSAYKLNKEGDNIQPGRIPFPIWNQFVVPCLVKLLLLDLLLKRQVRKQQLEWTWNNRLVPNWERNMSRPYIVTLVI